MQMASNDKDIKQNTSKHGEKEHLLRHTTTPNPCKIPKRTQTPQKHFKATVTAQNKQRSYPPGFFRFSLEVKNAQDKCASFAAGAARTVQEVEPIFEQVRERSVKRWEFIHIYIIYIYTFFLFSFEKIMLLTNILILLRKVFRCF